MKSVTTDRSRILNVMRLALSRLDPQDELARQIQDALAWAEHEPQLVNQGEVDDVGDRYISTHPVIATFQSAAETNTTPDFATLDAMAGPPVNIEPFITPPSDSGKVARYLDYVNSWVRGRLFRKDARFRWDLKRNEYISTLQEDTRVALVGDWGTGFRGAWKVAMAIREREPDHVIHLGDVYPSGQREEIQDKFIDIWSSLHFEDTTFWALNGNHEMISGGHDYVAMLLGSFCAQQQASYFVLENRHWRVIGIDTSFENHGFHRMGQDAMLLAMLADSDRRKILLSHHQPYSWFDPRPNDRGGLFGLGRRHHLKETIEAIFDQVRPVNPEGLPTGWFWGHEHGCIIYENDADGVRGRCIGHGGKDIKLDYYRGKKAENSEAPPIKQEGGRRLLWDVELPDQASLPRTVRKVKNGFVLLDLHGPDARISYIDEDGGVWWEERW